MTASLIACLLLALAQSSPPAAPPATSPTPPPVRDIEPPSEPGPSRVKDHTVARQPPKPPPDPGAPAQPVAPPFIDGVGANVLRPVTQAGQMPRPYIAGASQWVVSPGSSWKLHADKVKPGDEILFTPMFHIPQDFGSLRGTKERPIVIRSLGPQPAAIACEEYGFKFSRAQHIVVENVMFLNATRAAVEFDGSPVSDAPPESDLAKAAPGGWPADFLVRYCTIAGTRSNPDHAAMRFRHANDVRVDCIRVDGWNDSALELDTVRRALVRGLVMVPMEKYAQRRGIAVLGASADISINACSFNKGISIGVLLGSPGVPGAEGISAQQPVERVRVDRSVFDRVATPITFVNVRDATISRVTIVDPTRCLYSILDEAGVVERVLVEKCLAQWAPGSVQRFSPHPERIAPTSITLGDNLWYSAELPAAFAAIGQPFGYQAAAQITSTNPAIDLNTLRPQSADGVRYGALSIATTAQPSPSFGPAGPVPQPPGSRAAEPAAPKGP